jgi:hypothetical protein
VTPTRWDVYGDPQLEELLSKRSGPPWAALRALVAELEWRADQVGRPLAYPWPPEIRRAPIADDTTVYGAIEFVLESRTNRIARILDVLWLPDHPTE